MADTLTFEQRYRAMSRVRSKNTTPEMLIRRGLHSLGMRFRLYNKKLPGKPDIVLPRYRVVIFIHGCFWHRHNCYRATTPTTNQAFWLEKFQKNVARDNNNKKLLLDAGWRVLTIWECAIVRRNRIPYCLLLDEIVRFIIFEKLSFKEISGRPCT